MGYFHVLHWLCFLSILFETFGETLPEKQSNKMMSSATTGKDLFLDILNKESLVRLSMVQKIQSLTMDVIDNKNDVQACKRNMIDINKKLNALETKNQKLEEENARLQKVFQTIPVNGDSDKYLQVIDGTLQKFWTVFNETMETIRLEQNASSSQLLKITSHLSAGWTRFGDSEYWLGKQKVKWSTAIEECEKIGAKLVEIESSSENNFVRMLAQKLTVSVWLGATDREVEGRWRWAHTNSLLTYSDWDVSHNQPNNYNNQDCLCLYVPYGRTWCDEPCDKRDYQYICERDAL
ncbi:CD209 antigen-like protein C [Saccostrea cucullata]|uniref:CD209 antigen-like protein C n=1 Tax=Saccostrea cuccullata TaxID=36930 RepID=UPI002ED22AD8